MTNSLESPGQSPRAGDCGDDDISANETIRLAQEGDAAAFERIYRRYNRRVYGLCLRMTKNEAEAEDLTQEAFLQVFRKIHTYRGQSAFFTWFHRLSVNIVLMSLRKRRLTGIPLKTTATMRKSPVRGTGFPAAKTHR